MMNKYVLYLTALFYAGVCASASAGDDMRVFVSNPSNFDRRENVEIKFAEIKNRKAFDLTGIPLPSQMTSEGALLIQVEVPANGWREYRIEESVTDTSTDTICTGRVYPERLDDVAWENDRCAYRTYGPALQASGERAFGFDIWTKSVKHPVVEKRYRDELQHGISYHQDHGEGMDAYNVGPSLGAGAPALLDSDGRIIYPQCWQEAEILDNGPLRFKVKLKYPPVAYHGDTIRETRVITLEAGNWLNKTEVSYEGLPPALRPMAGIVVHKSNPEGYRIHEEGISYRDLTDNPANNNGDIHIGLIWPESKTEIFLPYHEEHWDIMGHICAMGDAGAERATYFWGASWEKGGVASEAEWEEILSRSTEQIRHPLQIRLDASESDGHREIE